MSWKSTMRSLQAAENRRQREQRQRYNQAIREQKELGKLQEAEQAAYEAEMYGLFVDLITSVHREASDTIDWEALLNQPSPIEPTLKNEHEARAKAQLESFKPSALDKLLRKAEGKQAELETAIRVARERDTAAYKAAQLEDAKDLAEWKEQKALASRILAGDAGAYELAIAAFDPLAELTELGVTVKIVALTKEYAEVIVNVAGDQLVPKQIKTKLKTGKLSTKDMPKGQYYAIYQDYVCGAVLRVAREFLATLPIERVFVTAETSLLNTATGHLEPTSIVSAVIVRKTLNLLDFEALDPSDGLQNFVHNMSFKKTSGFSRVQRIDPRAYESVESA